MNYSDLSPENKIRFDAASYKGAQTLEAWTAHITKECTEGSANLLSQVPQCREGKNGGFEARWFSEDGAIFQTRFSTPPISKEGRPAKYLSPSGQPTVYRGAICQAIATAIELHHGLKPGSVPTQDFWGWVAQNTKIPLWITEGAKKAAALMATGRVAVAVAGVYNGFKADDDRSNPLLVPTLKPLATAGRPIVLAFDSDSKKSTQEYVNTALDQMAGCLVDLGCLVRSASWDGRRGKGIDDLIVNAGPNALNTLFYIEKSTGSAEVIARQRKAKTANWKATKDAEVHAYHAVASALLKDPSLQVAGQKYISAENADTFTKQVMASVGTVSALSADMGSGKTYMAIRDLMAQFLKVHKNGVFIYIAPRITLVQGVCRSLGITCYTDSIKIDKHIRAIGVTMESLHRLQPLLDKDAGRPQSPVMLITDEFSQTVKQLLTSDMGTKTTEEQYTAFRLWIDAIKENGHLVISEDQVTESDLAFTGLPRGAFFKFDRVAPTRTFHFLGGNKKALPALTDALQKGKNVIVSSDSIKFVKAVAGVMVDLDLVKPDQTFILSSETDGEDRADFIADPIGYVKDKGVRFLGITPAGQTGVSINDEGDNPWFGCQVISLTHLGFRSGRQMFMRLRSDSVPTYASVKHHSIGFSNLGCPLHLTRPEAVAEEQRKMMKGMIGRTKSPANKTRLAGYLDRALPAVPVSGHLNSEICKAIGHNMYDEYMLLNRIKADLKGKGHTVFESDELPIDAPDGTEEKYAEYMGTTNEDPLIQNQTENPGLVRIRESKDLADIRTDLMDRTQANKIAKNPNASKQDRDTAAKFELEQKYPTLAKHGTLNIPAGQVVLNTDKFLSKLELRTFVLDAGTRERAEETIVTRILNDLDGDRGPDAYIAYQEPIVSKIRKLPGQAALIASLGLEPFFNGDIKQWSKETVLWELENVKDLSLNASKEIYASLKMVVKEDQSPAAIINKLLRKLGYRIATKRQRDGDLRGTYWYSIECPSDAEQSPDEITSPTVMTSLAPLRCQMEKAVMQDLTAHHLAEYCRVVIGFKVFEAVRCALGKQDPESDVFEMLVTLEEYQAVAADGIGALGLLNAP